MNINLQQLLVALVMLVPGFIASEIQKLLFTKRYSSDLVWVVKSLLTAIVLNGLTLSVALVFSSYQLDKITVAEVSKIIQNISIQVLIIYFGTLYLLSAVYGFLVGRFPGLRLPNVFIKLGFTQISDEDSVWKGALKKYRSSEKPNIWLKIAVTDSRTIFARLKHSSQYVDFDSPFEVYVKHIHNVLPDGSMEAVEADGMYLRLNPEQVAEVFYKPKQWMPS